MAQPIVTILDDTKGNTGSMIIRVDSINVRKETEKKFVVSSYPPEKVSPDSIDSFAQGLAESIGCQVRRLKTELTEVADD